MANEHNLQPPFQPNDGDKKDPRINRKGRPKSFDAARKLAQEKMNEPAIGADGKPIIRTKNGKEYVVTNAEMFFEAWMKSKDRKSFAEFAYGKVKEEVELTGKDGEPLIPTPETMKPSEIAERVAALLKLKDANGN